VHEPVGAAAMFGLPREIAGTIIAAAIAAFISLVGLIITKESKVSEFRQAWIDALRADIASLITHSYAGHTTWNETTSTDTAKWLDARGHVVSFNEAWARIKLRLNPKEKSSTALLKVLREHEDLWAKVGDAAPDWDALVSVTDRILAATQVVLKEEWQRVKRGERVYRLTTLSAGLLVLGGVYLLLRPSLPSWLSRPVNEKDYRVVERTDTYVDKQGATAPESSHDHEIVGLVLTHDDHRIHAICDLSTLDRLDPNASCGLRPLRNYQCFVGRDDVMKAPMPLSDLTCADGDGRKVYLYVSKED
jgi:hypothetical protein